MSSRHGARLAAILAPAALLLPSTAHAEKVVTEDPAGDAVTLDPGGEDLDEGVPAPEHTEVDVVRTTVAHGANRLRVQVRFRGLGREPFQFTVIRVSTPKEAFDIAVERLGGSPITSMDRGRRSVDCAGLKSKVDLRSDTVTTTLPTSCLDAPRWVQVGVGAIGVTVDPDSSDVGAVFADDAHRGGSVRDHLVKGPKVRRG